MTIIAWILWIALWGAAGYFAVGAILNRIAYRRAVKQLNEIYKLCDEVEEALKKEF